jgi:hypothetical protein
VIERGRERGRDAIGLVACACACVLAHWRASLLPLVFLSRCMGSGMVGAWLSLLVCLHCACVLALCLHAQCDVGIERHVFACMPSGRWA